MHIPLRSLASGVKGGLRSGLKTIIYALDDDGRMWAYDRSKDEWKLIEGPTMPPEKDRPDEPTDEIKPWHKL